MRWHWGGMGPKSHMAGVLKRSQSCGHRPREKAVCAAEGRDCSDTAAGQEMSETASNHQQLEGEKGAPPGFRGSVPLLRPPCRASASWAVWEANLWFRPSSLWSFVMATWGHWTEEGHGSKATRQGPSLGQPTRCCPGWWGGVGDPTQAMHPRMGASLPEPCIPFSKSCRSGPFSLKIKS